MDTTLLIIDCHRHSHPHSHSHSHPRLAGPSINLFSCQVALLTVSPFFPFLFPVFSQSLTLRKNFLQTGYAAIFAFAMGNYLLLCRATALWGGTRKIVWGMTLFFLVSYIATISTATVASLQLAPAIFYSSQAHICAVSLRPTTFGAIWIPSVIFEIVLFLLLFIKLFEHAKSVALATPRPLQPQLHPHPHSQHQQVQVQERQGQGQKDGRRNSFQTVRNKLNLIPPAAAKITIPVPVMTVTFVRRSPSKILHTLYKDGFVYFVVILGLRVFNLIAWAVLPISLIFIGIFLLWSFTTVLLTRMHLNLKAIGHPQRRNGVSTSSSTSLSVHQLRRLDFQRARPGGDGGDGGDVVVDRDPNPKDLCRKNAEEREKEEEEEKQMKREMEVERKKQKRKISFKSGRVSPDIAFRHPHPHPHPGPHHNQSQYEHDDDDYVHGHDRNPSHAFTNGGLTTFTIDMGEEEFWLDHIQTPRTPSHSYSYSHTISHPHHQHVENIDE
ncbi:hypothetical protein FRC16_007486, partial [Serendipita sp. 398]